MKEDDAALNNFAYWCDCNRVVNVFYRLRNYVTILVGTTPPWPPVRHKRFRLKSLPTLTELCHTIGYSDKSAREIFSFHERRLWRRGIVITVLLLILIAAALYLSINLFNLVLPHDSRDPFSILGAVITFITYFLLVGVFVRLAFIIADKHFADSLCLMTIVYLLIELQRTDILTRPDLRVDLRHRIDLLARNTLLLHLRFSSRNEVVQCWAHKHFKNMEVHIRERERWVIAPIEGTRSELERDFRSLFPIYLGGRYGDFQWSGSVAGDELPMLTWKQRVVRAIPKATGLLLPIILLGVLLKSETQFGLETNVITPLLLAWILLTVDSILSLGIAANFTNLVKGIKELK